MEPHYNGHHWNPTITDTIGTSKLVLLMEVSFVEGFRQKVSKWNKSSH